MKECEREIEREERVRERLPEREAAGRYSRFITALPPRAPPTGIIIGRTLHLHSPLIDDALVTCANHLYLPCLRVINTWDLICWTKPCVCAARPRTLACGIGVVCPTACQNMVPWHDGCTWWPAALCCAVRARPYYLDAVPERIPVGLFLRSASWWAFTWRCVVRALPW